MQAASTAAQSTAPPALAEATKFMADVDTELRRLWTARDKAAWVNANFITDDTEALSASGEEATSEYMTRTILAARRFDGLTMPEELARKFKLLKLGQTVPAPTNASERAELAKVQTEMGGLYGKGKYCPPEATKLKKYLVGEKGKEAKKCLNLDELSKILKTSRDFDELTEAWTGWHSISVPI